MWEQFRKTINQDEDEDEDKPKKADEAPPADPKPMTDEELSRRLRDVQKIIAEQSRNEEQKIESLEVGKETVRTVSTRTFASLSDMLRQSYSIFSQTSLAFENVRLANDSDGRLRFTLSPHTRTGDRYTKSLRQQWKLSGAKSVLTIIFPGSVASSGFPKTEGKSTTWTIEGARDESIEAALKLYSTPIVITADAGGLKVPEP